MITRRSFVQASSAFFGLGLFACRSAPERSVWSVGEEVRMAIVGVRGRGNGHAHGFAKLPGVKVVAICDVDRSVLAQRAEEYDKAGFPVDTHVDLREVLDRQDVDAISIATPNHLHALQSIWACQAGKDVYVEKPVSHNVWEGRQIVRAARKYGRVVMTGTQCRSSEGIAEGLDFVRGGGLGAIKLARGLCYKPRQSIGKVDGPQELPPGVDYDLWTGPAPLKPLLRKQLHYDWHWVFDTGNGDVGNQGIHQMDIARWALGEEGLPRGVMSIGGRLGYEDDGNTPNTQVVMLDYPTAPLFFEVRGLPRDQEAQAESWNGQGMDDYLGARIGVVIHCEEGHLLVPSYDTAIAYDGAGQEVQRWKGSSNHYAHFIDVLRSGRFEDSRADIRQGHVSSALCHMGNVSHLMGHPASVGEVREAVQGDADKLDAWKRMHAHLMANGVDLERTPPTLGPWLAFDPERERFEDRGANEFLSRAYREPFVVPQRV